MKYTKQVKSIGAVFTILSAGFLADAQLHEAQASCVKDPYLGSLCLTAASYCPQKYKEANGDLLPIHLFQQLFGIIGTTYGGDGNFDFALPDLRGRTPVHYGKGPGLEPVELGELRGQESVTQTVEQMPEHTHSATFTPTGKDSSVESATNAPDLKNPVDGAYIGTSGSGISVLPSFVSPDQVSGTVKLGGVSGNIGGTVSVTKTGEGKKQTNIPPQLGLRYCIAYLGDFPPRK